MKQAIPALLLAVSATCALAASAQDIVLSGYGTVGYAISDQPYNYQRHINNQGTFERDSVFALQLDTAITPGWSATVQVKLASDEGDDSRWKPQLAWAFVSWRPTNDWLLRAGKLRVPGYLNSESMDVGTTFDYARLPIEVYAISPTYDFAGASFNKTFELESGELALDGYLGKADTQWRVYLRDGLPGLYPPGAIFEPVELPAKGLALTYRDDRGAYRLGFHQTTAKRSDGQVWTIPSLVNLAPGISYYDVQPGPGSSSTDTLNISVVNIGSDISLGHGVAVSGELARRRAKSIESGINSVGAYLAVRKRVGHWTPYIAYARLKSDSGALDVYPAINGSSVPGFIPGAGLINASQRAVADHWLAYDQSSWAIGTSYTLTPASKLKAEWMQTRVGLASSLVDAPLGGNVSQTSINVLSLSYSFTF